MRRVVCRAFLPIAAVFGALATGCSDSSATEEDAGSQPTTDTGRIVFRDDMLAAFRTVISAYCQPQPSTARDRVCGADALGASICLAHATESACYASNSAPGECAAARECTCRFALQSMRPPNGYDAAGVALVRRVCCPMAGVWWCD